jgi:signal transduction histidine kinase
VALGRAVLALTPLELAPSINLASQVGVSVLGAVWIGALLVSYARAPHQPFWLLILAYLWTDQIWLLGYIPASLPWTFAEAFLGIHDAVSAHLLIAFPTGLLASRFDRRLVALIYAFVVGTSLAGHAVWRPDWTGAECYGRCPDNLLLVWPNDDLVRLIDVGSTLLLPFIAVAVVIAVLRHWRRATPPARRTLQPVVVATPLVVVLTTLWYLAQDFELTPVTDVLAGQLFLFVDFIIPIGVLLGLLRSRIHRSVVADLALKLSRGVPLGGLRDAVARAVRDPTLEIAFPAADGEGLVHSDGSAFDLPSGTDRAATRLERDGELLAVLVYDAAIAEEDAALVEAVGSVARLALENERLAAQVRAQLEEVRASRTRIVEAADAERRRVERDLHDGAQQRLVALTMRLELARDTAAGAQSLLDEATAELRAAIAEVRDLARGLHPTILTEAGLAAAVDALAERTPVPVRVAIPERRFPAPVEAAAYFVVAEALTNVVRYAAAAEARVTASVDGDRLVIGVEDDGAGGADPERGSRLHGLRDRVAAMGGSLAVTSPPGRGTLVQTELPLT